MGAYELIEALKIRDSRPVTPPTVYRVLDFLMAEGIVAKIESRSAYVPCAHPERRHRCLFLLCDQCGSAVELSDPEIEERLAEDASKLGFQIQRCVVEVQGTCAHCFVSEPA